MAALVGRKRWQEIKGKHDREIFPAEVARTYEEEERQVFEEGRPLINKIDPYYDNTGQLGYVQTSKWPRYDGNGQVNGLIGVSVDITERILTERRLRQAASVFDHTCEVIVITDADVRIVEVNDAFTQITGYTPEDVVGRNPSLLKAGGDDDAVHADMWRGLESKGHWSGEMWNRRKNGELYVQYTSISAVHDQDGEIESYVSLFHDATTRVTYTDELKHAAHHDPLTGLPNRSSLEYQLAQSRRIACRDRKLSAVLFLDLDLFKPINDRLGHQIGDRVLIELSRRLEHCVRDSDYVSRLGGDEFVIILNGLDEAKDATPVAQKMLERLAEPYEIDEHLLNISVSVGISIYPDDGDTNPRLLKAADKAMYAAKKRKGQNSFYYFSELPTGEKQINETEEE